MADVNETAIAPCLADGPLAETGRAATAAARELGNSSWAAVARAWSVPFLFHSMERAFASGEDPVPPLQAALADLAAALHAAAAAPLRDLVATAEAERAADEQGDVERVTGEHYGRLFQGFSARSYHDETPRLLGERLERNGISPDAYAGRSVLDAGCGGGRYTVAWRQLGAGRADGVDISGTNVEEGRRRAEAAVVDGVDFRPGNVLDLPLEDASYDIVFSNGVLHHTKDWEKGIAEMLRVLRPGGWGWLYLIENPGGLFWDTIEILRVVTSGIDRARAGQALRTLGVPGNRVFYMLDHVMVPINLRLTPDEIETALRSAGATDIRRLERGTDFDRIEAIHRGDPFATVKYGAGENRFVFSK
jgi:SAM-dependent methyltransferase